MENVRILGKTINPPSLSNFKNTINSRYGPGTNLRVKQLEKSLLKLARESNHLEFLIKCRDNNIIPKGLIIKSPYNSPKSRTILHNTSLKLLKERIKHHRFKRFQATLDIKQSSDELKSTTGNDFDKINSTLINRCNTYSAKLKDKHTKKFNRLLSPKGKPKKDSTVRESPKETTPVNTVVNLSSRTLTETEAQLLSKGLKFAVKNNKPKYMDFIAGIESATPHLTDENKEELRCKVRMALNMKNQKTNISSEEIISLKGLKLDANVKILPADKGNATVLLNSSDYGLKIKEVLEAGKYKELKKDPTKIFDKKVVEALKKLKGILSDSEIKNLKYRIYMVYLKSIKSMFH